MAIKGNASKRYPNTEGVNEALARLAENHISNTANPHQTTASRIGAAEKVHSHGIVNYSEENKTGDIKLTDVITGGINASLTIKDNEILYDSLFDGSEVADVSISASGDIEMEVSVYSDTCVIYLNGKAEEVKNGSKFTYAGNVSSLSVELADGEVVFEKFAYIPSRPGFMSPEMLAMLLSAVSKESLDKILASYYDAKDISDRYYDKTKVEELINNITVFVDSEYNKNSDNAQSGKAVAQAISQEVAKIIGTSGEALDTLSELANALGNDPNFATTVMEEIGKKAGKDEVYNKRQIDSLLSDKVNAGSVLTPSETEVMFLRYNGQVNQEVDAKIAQNQKVVNAIRDEALEAATNASKAVVDAKSKIAEAEQFLNQANERLDNVYEKEVVEEKLEEKADNDKVYKKDETFSKTEITTAIADAVAKLVDSSPQTLDTLNEVAKALGNDPNFATTIMALIGEKANAKDVYTATQTDSAIAEAVKGKANIGDSYTKEENDSKTADAIKDKADKDDVSNSFKGQANGELIQIDDVSPIVHNIKVKSSPGVKVIGTGKNLIGFPYAKPIAGSQGVSSEMLQDGGLKVVGTNEGTAIFTHFLETTDMSYEGHLSIKKGTYFLSGTKNGVEVRVSYYRNANSERMSVVAPATITFNDNNGRYSIFVAVRQGVTVDEVVYPMLELGTEATEYEKSPRHVVVSDADGNAIIPSVYPTTTLFTDVDGAVIEAEYNKDLNKVFGDIDEALDAILAIQEQYLPAEAVAVEEADEGGEDV